MKNVRQFNLDRDFFRRKVRIENITWKNSLRKIVYLGLAVVQTVEIIFLAHPDRVFQH